MALELADYKDAITLIHELGHKQRDKGIRLFLVISNNIIDHPSERKWRYLHYDKIHKKFGKCDEFIQLMLHSGFKLITKPQKILVFNNKKVNLLKLVIKSLTSYGQHQNQEENINKNIVFRNQTNHRSARYHDHGQMEIRPNYKDNDIYYCICDNPLYQTTPDDIYGKNNDNVLCDGCMIELKGNDIIWHCFKGTDCEQHKYNYDLCETCVSLRSSQRSRQSLQSQLHRSHYNRSIVDDKSIKVQFLNDNIGNICSLEN